MNEQAVEDHFIELETPDYLKAAEILLADLRAYPEENRDPFYSTVKLMDNGDEVCISLIIWDCGTLNFAYQLEHGVAIPDTEYGMSTTSAHGPDKHAVEEYLLECLSQPAGDNFFCQRTRALKDWINSHD